MIDHGDGDIPPLQCEVDESITIGPISIFFGNQNLAMKIKAHQHTANVWVTYSTDDGGHGYPSFQVTNDALRDHIRALTNRGLFLNATNEDVCRRLFAWLDGWEAEEWVQWGGDYHLIGVTLDVIGTHDKIGHDDGATRYTVTRRN